jgi:hypothetical protein
MVQYFIIITVKIKVLHTFQNTILLILEGLQNILKPVEIIMD